MLRNLFSLKLWFSLRPGLLTPTGSKVFLIIIALLLLGLVIFAVTKKIYSKTVYVKTYSDLLGFFRTNLIIGLFIYLFFYQGLVFLSMRLWFLVWMASMVVWLVFVVKRMKQIPGLIEQREKEKEFKKYLPNNGK